MNEYLFNTNVIIIVSIVASLSCFLFCSRIVPKLSLKQIVGGILIAIGLMILEVAILDSSFGLQETPVAGYYVLFIINFILAATVLHFKHLRYVLYGISTLLASLLLLAVIINDYYQYYPTVRSIVTHTTRKPEATATVLTPHAINAHIQPSIEKILYGNGLNKGSLTTITIPGAVSHLNARPAYIYLPPSYNDAAFAATKFPAIILLTGTPGTPSSWLQGNLFINSMDSFASHHAGITPVVIIADHSGSFANDTECVDSAHGNADTYLTTDIPSYIETHYRISANADNWGIAGFSEGGMCAALLTLEHQDVFRHFLDIAGDPFPYLNDTKQTLPVLFHGSKEAQKAHNVDWLIQNTPLADGLTAQFAIGANDNKRLIAELRHTYNLASQHKVTSSFESIAHHGHDFTAWSTAYRDALPRMSYYLGATECESVCSL